MKGEHVSMVFDFSFEPSRSSGASAVVQRVLSASVTVDNVMVSKIGKGILIFAAVAPGDTAAEVDRMASKLVKTRFWDDAETGHRWRHSVKDIAGEVLCVSQFTLLAKTTDGLKPSFHGAMDPVLAKELYERFVVKVGEAYDAQKVKDGVFQAMMEVALVNDGPVTLEFNVHAPKPKDPPQPKQPKAIKKIATPDSNASASPAA